MPFRHPLLRIVGRSRFLSLPVLGHEFLNLATTSDRHIRRYPQIPQPDVPAEVYVYISWKDYGFGWIGDKWDIKVPVIKALVRLLFFLRNTLRPRSCDFLGMDDDFMRYIRNSAVFQHKIVERLCVPTEEKWKSPYPSNNGGQSMRPDT